MTRQLNNKTQCPQCKHEFDTTTPFSQWMRKLSKPLDSSKVSSQNLDYIWDYYKENWFILVEEKRHGSQPQFAQEDTHNTVASLLKAASGTTVLNKRGEQVVKWFRGYYVVVFEKTNPLDSQWVEINGTRYDNPDEAVKQLLRHGRMSKTIELDITPSITDVQGFQWLSNLAIERIPELLRWLGARLVNYAKAESKDKAA